VGLADATRLLPQARGTADVHALVDGQVKFERLRLNIGDGGIEINVPLGSTDRFLTLATTASSGHAYDWVVFGDPTLDMEPTETEEGK
jgi:hypothetical protein